MIDLAVQNESSIEELPSKSTILKWVSAVLQSDKDYELCIRIVDNDEIHTLNKTYRHKDKPTNVLAFPADLPTGIEHPHLGDIIISAPYVLDEAKQLNTEYFTHFAHMVVHATLHLLGHDHQEDEDTKIMQAQEITILANLGFPNPYRGSK